jgi:hypothetical protein
MLDPLGPLDPRDPAGPADPADPQDAHDPADPLRPGDRVVRLASAYAAFSTPDVRGPSDYSSGRGFFGLLGADE